MWHLARMTLSVVKTQHNNDSHYAECCYAESHERRYAECLYAECHYAECHYAECRGAARTHPWQTSNIQNVIIKLAQIF